MGKTPPGQTREKVFALVRERLLAGVPPTVREVQKAFRFRSVQTAREHLEALVGEGRLAKCRGQARGYRLPDGAGFGDPTVLVPLLGRVQAGALTGAVEDLEGYVPIQSRRPPGELFGLRVRGDSMSGAGILEGDVVIVHRRSEARTGEVVVALVGDEATVKRLRVRGGRVELHPENPDFQVIVPDPAELTVLGRVVEVRRSLERA
jgi:repressor LexA